MDPFERLQLVREHFNTLLPRLDGVNKVIGLQGEIWSPRKVLRRARSGTKEITQNISANYSGSRQDAWGKSLHEDQSYLVYNRKTRWLP